MLKKIKKLIYVILCTVKLTIARAVSLVFCRKLYRKNIWLISEKENEARDNGYHFYRYLRENHPEVSAFFVITKESSDYDKVKKYGNVIFYNTWQHYLYSVVAKMSICSQMDGSIPGAKSYLIKMKALFRKDQKIVFLQHGVIKDDLSSGLDYSLKKYSLFICSAEKERSFVQSSCHYPDGIVQNLGLCRFDALFEKKKECKKQILIMPTFRIWLAASNITKEATDIEKEKFTQSQYYQMFSQLLSHKKLQTILKKFGFSVVFYPHYAMQSFVHCFEKFKSEDIVIADRMNYDVQQLLIESAVLVTDFSSVFFDFAYMEKPEIFFQFDEEQYRSGHYKEGYFDYRRDAFGPVVQTVDAVVDYLEKLIRTNCCIESSYLQRVYDFFERRDGNNCERTYQKVLEISQEK